MTSNFANLYQKSGGANTWGGGLSNLFDSSNKDRDLKENAKMYQAYQSYLNGIANQMKSELEARADKYDQKLQNQFNEAEPQYQQEAGTQLPEITQLVQDIANQSAEAQRQNQRQINASLAQQGVRGGQAAILANRATGELNRDLQRDINQTVYDEAANRQNSRLNYYSNKALTPWNAMSNAYSQSMIGANNALSNAQGSVYGNDHGTGAMNLAMKNYLNTYRSKNKGGLGSSIGSIAGGAIGTYFGGPIGGAIGSQAGQWAGGKIGSKF